MCSRSTTFLHQRVATELPHNPSPNPCPALPCRTLFEVANLERSTVLQNEACLTNLAEAVRMAYKVHQFAGGFNGDALELFTKVKRLAQYYSRTLDPTWLKDNTRQGAAGTLQPWGLNA